MKATIAALILCFSTLPGMAQMPLSSALPKALISAKTVAVLNDTHVDAVEQGAIDALKAWGRFTVIDDPEAADVTLRFDKSKDHAGQDSQKPDSSGNPSYSYSMSFSTSVHMKAYMKDGTAPFYTTKTDDSKQKAGTSCVSDLRTAMRMAR